MRLTDSNISSVNAFGRSDQDIERLSQVAYTICSNAVKEWSRVESSSRLGDFINRADLAVLNKRTIDSLIAAGLSSLIGRLFAILWKVE